MSGKTKLQEVAENMAEAIREWNRAKLERESWVPVVGQVPPVGILGGAKKANAMLAKSLEEYETFQQSVQADGGESPLEKLIQPDCDMPGDGYP